MGGPAWPREFPAAVTVCDMDGVVLEMNDRSAQLFAADGGRKLIGSSLLDCHPEPSRTKLLAMLADGTSNVYTIEKGGAKTLFYQAPWYENGQRRGLVEIALPLPAEISHFVRDS